MKEYPSYTAPGLIEATFGTPIDPTDMGIDVIVLDDSIVDPNGNPIKKGLLTTMEKDRKTFYLLNTWIQLTNQDILVTAVLSTTSKNLSLEGLQVPLFPGR